MVASSDIPVAKIPKESIYLRPEQSPTLQGQLSAAIVRSILETAAPPGTRLPSSRALAQELGISRMTVTLVYQELAAQGYLQPVPRSGVAVAATVPHRRVSLPRKPAPGSGVNWNDWLSDHPRRRRVIQKPADWRDFKYPFIFGQADPRLFDHTAWRDCARRALGTRDFGQLAADQFARDDPLLIDYICSNTLRRRGIHATPDQVLLTMGAQNALYIAVELLARRDRLAVIEEPGYPDFAETLRRAQSPTAFLNVDQGGLDPARLPENARLVIVTPSHNIPTGATMPLARRKALLQLAARRDFLVIEDDYDYEMSYLAPPAPALKSLDDEGRVVYIGSFSKSLFPGLRIGYMVGTPEFIDQARNLRAIMLRHPPSHLQRITAYFLALGHYDAHIVRLRETMRRRRAVVSEALSRTGLRIAGAAQQGGTSMWIEAGPDCDASQLARDLVADSVLIEPGEVFFENPPRPCPFFRLGYGSIIKPVIPEGIRLIARRAGLD